jgi:hypothetical protein
MAGLRVPLSTLHMRPCEPTHDSGRCSQLRYSFIASSLHRKGLAPPVSRPASRRPQSRPLRASREASKHITASTSGAKPRYQPFEARPRHHPGGRAAQVIIDQLCIAQAELILPHCHCRLSSCFGLSLGGMPKIETDRHCLAVLRFCGSALQRQIRARHRRQSARSSDLQIYSPIVTAK